VTFKPLLACSHREFHSTRREVSAEISNNKLTRTPGNISGHLLDDPRDDRGTSPCRQF
jgi:hypothetical protein